MHELQLENIKIFAYHGCMAVEQAIGSYYEVNLWVKADLSRAAQTDDINDTVNYVILNEIIHDQMAIVSKTIEHVCQQILTRIGSTFSEIEEASIKISKINPPVAGELKKFSVFFRQKYC